FPAFETVQPGTAIQYRENDSNEVKWCIIEDAPDPDGTDLERSPEDSLTRAMMAKMVNDIFELRSDPPPPRTATILAIQSKLEYRWRYCFLHVEERFADESPIKGFRLPHDEQGKPEINLFLEQIKSLQAPQQETALATYAKHSVPIHLVSHLCGRSDFEAVQLLASSQQSIRCARGTSEAQQEAVGLARRANTLILDEVTCGTLYLLQQYGCANVAQLLNESPWRVIISEFIVAHIKAHIQHQWGQAGDQLSLGVHEGQVQMTKLSAEEAATHRRDLEQFVTALETICEVRSGEVYLELGAERRELYETGFGRGGTHSLMMSARGEGVLWTDDGVLGDTAVVEHRAHRVWSQSVVIALAKAGVIPESTETAVSCWLLAWGYNFTSIGGRHVRRASELTEWDPKQQPLRAVLEEFSKEHTELETMARIAAETLQLLWQKGAVDQASERVTLALLNEIARRSGGRRLVRSLAANADSIFGIDVMTGARVTQLLRAWLAGNRGIEWP
ncbi:MAG: PIN domain-containing protein, partial [bacterium]